MNQQANPGSAQPPWQDDLIAYLDGEMDVAGCRRVESILSSQPGARRDLEQLERTWSLLDQLPRARVDGTFTRTTVEMVAVSESQAINHQNQDEPKRRRRTWLIGACSLLAAAVVGFVTVTTLIPDPNEELLREYPVLEHLDEYRQAGSIDFLQQLSQEGLFVAEATSDGR